MREQDLIQKLSFCGLKYARILTEKPEMEELEKLRQKYSYIHVYSYTPFEAYGFESRVQPTLIIDLTKDLDNIFFGFNSTARKHVRRAEKNPELELKILDDNFEQAYQLYRDVKSSEGAKPDIKREFSGCFFFNAYLKRKMIVTMSFYDNGEFIRAKHTASLRRVMGDERKFIAHASRELIWKVCQWGKENGRRYFDLAGVNYTDPEKAGVRAFKESFGGRKAEVWIAHYQTSLFSVVKRGLNYLGKNIN